MPDIDYIREWVIAFLATIALEAPLIFLLLKKLPARRVLVAFLTANCTSHPFLWFALPIFEPYWFWVITAELSIIAYEGLVYCRVLWAHISVSKAIAASLAANALSCAVGVLL